MRFTGGRGVLHRIALLALAAPRRIVACAVLLAVAAAVFGIPVANNLSAGGFQDPDSPSARATQVLVEKFRQSDMQLFVLVTDPTDVNSPTARAVGSDIVAQLKQSPHVTDVTSPWTVGSPQAAAPLVSRDSRAGLIIAAVSGGDNDGQKYADELSEQLAHDRDGVTVRAGGTALVIAQVNHQIQRDLLAMELIVIPLSFLVLVWVFGGALAALPIVIGGMAMVGGLAMLRLITFATDVSIFALNLTLAVGLALAIDYTLLIISRYREEIAAGVDRDTALIRTMTAAGRTVVFSAVTVALSLSATMLFPMYFLRSFAYAGVSTVLIGTVAALVVTPAGIVLLGARIDAYDVRKLARRLLRRADPVAIPVEQLFWYRSTKFVTRRAIPVGLSVIVFLLFLGIPFLGVKWGYPDDRVLPPSASSHEVGSALRTDFTSDTSTQVAVVVPEADGLTPPDFDRYAAELSRVAEVSAVSAPTGTFVAGKKVGPPTAAAGVSAGSALLTVSSTAPLYTESSDRQLDALYAVAAPDDRTVELTGTAAVNRDSVNAIGSRVPWVLGLIAVITLVLLFMLTGSVVLPIKALLLNALSLTAAFGALVWIFQEGHLGALGTTSTGTLVANIPVLLFCIAFGLSMDYEVFLVSRIREYWLASDRRNADNDESVALGLARTGRVVTAAALVMSISFAGLIASHVSFMRMFGLGLALAVLVDATLVRMMLLPAFMHVLGQWNWWAPKPLVRLHEKIGISESDEPALT
jgi:putative drug exporter of the RND superfamily